MCVFGNVWVGVYGVTRVCVYLGNVSGGGSVGNLFVWVYELKSITLINI